MMSGDFALDRFRACRARIFSRHRLGSHRVVQGDGETGCDLFPFPRLGLPLLPKPPRMLPKHFARSADKLGLVDPQLGAQPFDKGALRPRVGF
jgi:hypothetical protein